MVCVLKQDIATHVTPIGKTVISDAWKQGWKFMENISCRRFPPKYIEMSKCHKNSFRHIPWLLHKLHSLPLSYLLMLQSYLLNTHFQIKIENAFTDLLPVNAGVTQRISRFLNASNP
jgi:hypothetical protein